MNHTAKKLRRSFTALNNPVLINPDDMEGTKANAYACQPAIQPQRGSMFVGYRHTSPPKNSVGVSPFIDQLVFNNGEEVGWKYCRLSSWNLLHENYSVSSFRCPVEILLTIIVSLITSYSDKHLSGDAHNES